MLYWVINIPYSFAFARNFLDFFSPPVGFEFPYEMLLYVFSVFTAQQNMLPITLLPREYRKSNNYKVST